MQIRRVNAMKQKKTGPVQYCTVREAAKILRVKPSTIRERIKRGVMPGRKIGRVYLVPRAYLEGGK